MTNGTFAYVSMLGMPVENHAVAISPQAMAIAVAEPPSKSTRRQLCASGTSSIIPFRRTRPPHWPSRSDSAIVRAVPGLHRSSGIECQNEVGSVGQRLLEHCGDAIGGDHIKSHTGADYDFGGLSIRVAALRGEKDFNFAGDIQIVVRLFRQASIIGPLVAANGPAQFATTATSASVAAENATSLRSKIWLGRPSSDANFWIGPALRPASTGLGPAVWPLQL